MSTATKIEYDVDFVEWTAQTAELLRQRRFAEVDLEHLAEEIEDLGKGDARAVRSQLSRMLMHLIKLRIQPERASKSWGHSIVDAQGEIERAMKDSPSLRRHLAANLEELYSMAVKFALRETKLTARAKELDIPPTCPYTLDELLTGELDSLWPR